MPLQMIFWTIKTLIALDALSPVFGSCVSENSYLQRIACRSSCTRREAACQKSQLWLAGTIDPGPAMHPVYIASSPRFSDWNV